jgi:mannose-6-phosphate isomerase
MAVARDMSKATRAARGLARGCRLCPAAVILVHHCRRYAVRSLHPHSSLASHRTHDMSGRTPVRTVPKPWGHETIWASNDLYVGKILHVNAGQSLSVQYHNVKDETVYLLSGEMKYWVQVEGSDELQDMRLKTGEAFRITPGTIHYIEAVTDCDVLEASTPHLDDVVRLKDRYGREGTSAP